MSNAHFEKKAPFSALETLDDDFFYFIPHFGREAFHSHRVCKSGSFFLLRWLLILLCSSQGRDQYLRREVNGTWKTTGGNFFLFTLTWRLFFLISLFNGWKGDFFCFGSSRFMKKKIFRLNVIKMFVFYHKWKSWLVML